MKKTVCLILLCALLSPWMLTAMAAEEGPQIILQPQQYTYPDQSVAIYTVKASGSNLHAYWYMQWEGTVYHISDMSNGMEPWEAYAGETYGASQPDANTFVWFFQGIEAELSGAEIWCVIEDGHYEATSRRALITVGGSAMPPELTEVPVGVTVKKHGECELRVLAKSPDGSQLSFLWYETDSGKLQDIRALNRGEEDCDFLFPDTSVEGTRNYVCMVTTEKGGVAYTSVIPVTVDGTATETEPAVTQQTTQETTEETAEATTEQTVPVTTQPAESTEPATQAADKTENTQSTLPAEEPDSGEKAAFPWLWIAVTILAMLGLSVIVTMLVMKRKGTKSSQ